MTQDKIKEILDILGTLKEYLLSLPDDMLLNIDPRDNNSLEQGFQFIKAFNNSLSLFCDGADKIETQIKNYFSINPEEEEIEHESSYDSENSRVIKELDKTEPHTLDEDFTYKRPYGFVLENSAYKGIKTWKSLYLQVLKELEKKDPKRFSKLPSEKRFVSKRGNPLFSENADQLRVAEKLPDGFFIEVNLSANHIRKNIKDLLAHYGIHPSEMKIYLREDRDA